MWTMGELLENFFTHKDFLPPADQIPGTLFTPLHFLFAAVCLLAVLLLCRVVSKKSEKTMRRVFACLWVFALMCEIVKIVWETCAGKTVEFNWVGILPLYPCSIFLYAMPFAVWGKGLARRAACGYVCTLGLLGGAINFVYPANILSAYSCISFAGVHTLIYHGTIVFCAMTMLASGYHSFTGVRKWWELFVPALPFFIVSLVANGVNFSPIGADYMFFKLRSFIFAPLGQALPTGLCVVIVYMAYLFIHAAPYIPWFLASRRKQPTD